MYPTVCHSYQVLVFEPLKIPLGVCPSRTIEYWSLEIFHTLLITQSTNSLPTEPLKTTVLSHVPNCVPSVLVSEPLENSVGCLSLRDH